jgi:hypothetical protein
MGKFFCSGTLYPDRLEIKEFNGEQYGGSIGGNGVLKWGERWSLAGNFNASEISLSEIAPGLFDSGRIKASGRYSMQAASSAKLFASPRIDGSFTSGRGVVSGIDMMAALKGGNTGGQSQFVEMKGSFSHAGNRTQVSGLRVSAGLLSAAGSAAVEPNGGISGRFSIDLQSPSTPEHASVGLSGKLAEPKFGG